MATVIIKRRDDPIFLENDRARKLKSRWVDETVPRTTIIDLGDVWCGTLGDIKAIEITVEKKVPKLPDVQPDTRTPEEKAEATKRIREAIAAAGIARKA